MLRNDYFALCLAHWEIGATLGEKIKGNLQVKEDGTIVYTNERGLSRTITIYEKVNGKLQIKIFDNKKNEVLLYVVRRYNERRNII